jgi:hypothetical protein
MSHYKGTCSLGLHCSYAKLTNTLLTLLTCCIKTLVMFYKTHKSTIQKT